jgi:threonylcarbamoyladenosine tRNA methylthiotransferase MtaB
MEVLFEQQVKEQDGYYEGLTPNYIRVVAHSDEDIEGQIMKVQLKERKEGFIAGTIVKNN